MMINEWAPAVKEQFPSWRGRLLQDNGIPHPKSLHSIDAVDRHIFFNGYKEYFTKLVPRDSPIVLSHNDAQENNILIAKANNRKLLVIDYEYAGWEGMASDLANHLNELMFDNDSLIDYVENDASEEEVRAFLTRYLKHYYERVLTKQGSVASWDEYIAEALPKFEQEVRQYRLLRLFGWIVWAFKMLKHEDVCSDTVFNYQYNKA